METAREPARPRRLSEELAAIVESLTERPVTLRELVSVLQGRAYTLLLLMLALPFCTPIPLPGVSTPFGAVIALIGGRLALRQHPWLPARLLDVEVPPRLFRRVLSAAGWILRLLEWALRPRWVALADSPWIHHAYGIVIMVSGLLLLLPLPVPLSNLCPALAVVLTASALLERDGVVAVVAFMMFLFSLGFFGALAWGGVEGVQAVRSWLAGH